MNSAATIDGIPVRMSTMNVVSRAQPAHAVLDEVDRATSMAMGTEISAQKPTSSSVPMIAW